MEGEREGDRDGEREREREREEGDQLGAQPGTQHHGSARGSTGARCFASRRTSAALCPDSPTTSDVSKRAKAIATAVETSFVLSFSPR
jgi:hypothetical protein